MELKLILKSKKKTLGLTKYHEINFSGISNFILNEFKYSESSKIKRWAKNYITESKCPYCDGKRLKKESLHFFIEKKKHQ